MAFDRGRGRVIGLGSFSKLLAPGLRVGWVHAHPALVQRFCMHGTLRSGGGLNPWMAAAVTALMADGRLGHHVDHLRATLAARADALSAALQEQLPSSDFIKPGGGYFLWVSLPGAVGEGAGVTVLPGKRCSPSGGCTDRARLSVSLYEASVLADGIERLRIFFDAR